MSEFSAPIPKDEPLNPELKLERSGFEVGFETIAKNSPNQDAILTNESLGVFGVFDGAGGHEGGADASRIAKDSVEEIISENPHISLADLLVQTSRKVTEGTPGLATGAVVRVVGGSQTSDSCRVEIASVGDSRVYIIGKDGTIKGVTTDNIDTYTSEELRNEKHAKQTRLSNVDTWDQIQREDEPAFNTRNIITACLGSGYETQAAAYEAEISKGDIVLITSDGVHDNLTDQEILSLTSSSGTAAELAKSLAEVSVVRSKQDHLRAKMDDTTAVVMKYTGEGFDTKPAAVPASDEMTSATEVAGEGFEEKDLQKGEQAEFKLENIPFPITLYLGAYELQLSLDEQQGRPPGLVVAIPGKSAGEYLSGKFAFEILAGETPSVVTIGRNQPIEYDLGVEFPDTVSRNHVELTYGNGRLIVKDNSTNGTSIKQ